MLVVADQALTSEAVRVALEQEGFAVRDLPLPGSTADLQELYRIVGEFEPAIGLLVLELLDPLGVQLGHRLLREERRTEWLMLTAGEEASFWGAALAAGASAVLPVDIGLQDLSRVLTRMLAGGLPMTESERSDLLRLWEDATDREHRIQERIERLTVAETQVLRRLADGRATTEIAREDSLAVGTVRAQVKAILRKLEVSSQLAAVAVLREAEQRRTDGD